MTEEIIFRTKVETGNTVKDLKAVDTELKNIKKDSESIGTDVTSKFEMLNQKIEKGGLSVRDYTRAVKEYQSIALEAGRTSPIGQEALNRAAAMQDEIGDLRNEVANLAHDGKRLQGALQIGSAVTAGYGAVQGAMALTGMQSESLEKTMVKLQAATTLLNGIEQIRTALEKESLAVMFIKNTVTKVATAFQYAYTTAVGTTTGAMKILRIAMLSIPIVAIIAGIAALVGIVASLMGQNEDLEASYDSLTKSIDAQNEALDRSNSKLLKDAENKIKLAKAQRKTEEEIQDLEKNKYKIQEDNRRRDLQQTEYNIQDKAILYKKAIKNEDEELAKKIGSDLRAEYKKSKDLVNLKSQLKIDSQVQDLEYQNSVEDKRKKDVESAKSNAKKKADDRTKEREEQKKKDEEEAQKKLDLIRKIEDLQTAYISDSGVRRLTELKINQQREREDLAKQFGANADLEKELKLKQASDLATLEKAIKDEATAVQTEKDKIAADKAFENRKSRIQGELIAKKEEFDAIFQLNMELALLERNRLLEDKTLTEDQKYLIEQQYLEKISKLKEDEATKDKERQKAVFDNSTKISEMGISAIQNLSDMVFQIKNDSSNKSDAEALKSAKKQFKINKALQLGGAVIDGAKAISASLAQAPLAIGVVPNPVGIASLAAAITSTGATIAKIAGTQFTGGGGGGASPISAPNVSGVTSAQVPTTESNLTANLQNNAQPQTTKVVVVDSDITKIQNRTKRADAVSTIG